MKTISLVISAALSVLLAGCATSSQVQEMINTSHQSDLKKSAKHEASIAVLKQSSMAALEQNKRQAATLAALQRQQEETLAALRVMQGNTEAAKVMSAANTVKGADLEEAVLSNREALAAAIERLQAIDALYGEVMILHYRRVADSANAALATLNGDKAAASAGLDNKPLNLDEPIDIVAPDTSVQ